MSAMILINDGDGHAEMDVAMNDAVFKAVNSLLGVKIAFARIARLMAALDVEGTINGVDVYEAVQGVHDFTGAALGYLVSQEDMKKLDGIKLADDAQFEKLISDLEEGGHA